LPRLAAAAGAWCCAGAAVAQMPSWAPETPRVIEDRLRAEVLVFGAQIDTTLRLDPSLAVQGTPLDAEHDLGLDDSKLLTQAEITLLPGERHLVRLSGMSVSRSAQTLLERDIVFDQEIYRANERVDSELDLVTVGLTYGFRFVARERGEFTGTFGIQVVSVEANAVVRSRVIREAESGVAPLPLVGLEGRFDFTERMSAEARLQYLSARLDDVEGSIVDARTAVSWRLNPHMVFGLGWRHLSFDIDSQDQGTPGYVDLTISGPLLFVRASL